MTPLTSVIVPVFEDPEGLTATLASLIGQDCPPEGYEIIVVDNGSTDSTYAQAKEFESRHSGRVVVLQEALVRGSYAARNKGIGISTGDLLCFIDAGVSVEPDYLPRVEQYFRTHDVDYVGCRVQVFSTHDTLSAKYELLRAFPVESFLRKDHFAPTCCLAVRRSVMDKVGLFDSRLESSGDLEFGRRVHAAGFTQEFAGGIVVRHAARWRYSSRIQKSRRIARGYAQLAHYRPQEYRFLSNRYFSLKNLLPANPARLKRSSDQAGVPVSWPEAVCLAFYHIPLKVFGLAANVAERRRLAAERHK